MATTIRRKPTLNDIAEEAGVSLSAVSRALRHPGRLNARTEAHIREVARRLGYLDDPTANDRFISYASTNLVPIIVSDIGDPLVMAATDGMRRRLSARGYHAAIIEENDIITRDGLASQFRKLPACGTIMQYQSLREQEIKSLGARMPLVLFGRDVRGIASGGIDTAGAVAHMLDALQAAGYASITCLAGADEGPIRETIRRQIADEAARRGMRMQTLLGCPRDAVSADSTLERFLGRPTHAVFATDNAIAVHFMAAAIRRGVRVPDELAVIGFGDDLTEGLGLPSLAHVSCPMEDLGTDCAEMLISLVKSQHPDNAVRNARFVAGGSTGLTHRLRGVTAKPVSEGRMSHTQTVDRPIELTIMASSFQDWDRHIDVYAKLHPEVSIRRVEGGSQAEIVAKLYQRTRAGRDIPDIAVVEYRWLPQLAEDRMLLNLNTPAIRATFRQQFVADCWNAARYGDGVYGVPCDYDTTVLFRRNDVLDRFGEQTPRTWEEVLSMGERMRRQDPSMHAVAFNTLDSAPFLALLYMASARPWSVDSGKGGIRLSLDSEPVRRTVALLQRGIDAGDILPMNFNDPAFDAQVRDARIATVFSANWFCESIVRNWPDDRGLWQVALPPSFGDPASLVTAHIGGSAWTISNRLPPERRNAAAQFALWAQTDPASVDVQLDRIMSATTYFHRNTRLTGRIDPFFGQKLYDVFFDAAEHLSHEFAYLPFMPQVEAVFSDTVRPQLVPGGDIMGQMANWQSQIAAFARAKGYEVEIC
ncbi:extracellular solute-binding protein [Bifidobacterium amazonense]|uniref:Extracellular solute-binding protein n=1 Tax=Bifidobacterium amazonense TaxID=2809027 RepID=A0ABS9VXP9_9BIFI|nr:extracellular solute-binding protein [Bifidobacterium amazonense]MCH9276882.1 extracellular solute-binding protein [Bifidobacterium amazonense]